MSEVGQALPRIVREFRIEGRCVGIQPNQRGHIHETFVSYWKQGGYVRRFLHQRMNRHVFKDIEALMHNIQTVTQHLHDELGLAGSFRTLRLVATRDGRTWLDGATGPWRTYRYIENTRSFDLCDSPARATEAARAFGRFLAKLSSLDPAELSETIPNFFSASHRLGQFEQACSENAHGRVESAAPEIAFVRERASLPQLLDEYVESGQITTRVVHGDTKLNNVLFDERTGRARSVVDLDTCMPGYSLYDFGDLVRFTAATAEEDETDLSKAGMDLGLYRALVAGYLQSAGSLLTDREIELMPFAARIVTFTLGVRFLTDHLAGDEYFKIHRPGQNLDRARVQFKMVEDMEANEQAMC